MLTVSRREAELTGTTEACLPPGTALEHAFLEQRFWSVVGKERSNRKARPKPGLPVGRAADFFPDGSVS